MCEVSAGCENGHCTVEFRRPEGKRAEVRWTTPFLRALYDSARLMCSRVKSIALYTRISRDKWYLHVNISSLHVSLSLERDISDYILPGNINVCISVETTRVYIDLHIIHSILEVNELYYWLEEKAWVTSVFLLVLGWSSVPTTRTHSAIVPSTIELSFTICLCHFITFFG